MLLKNRPQRNRHRDEEAREVRAILDRQDYARHYAAASHSGANSTR